MFQHLSVRLSFFLGAWLAQPIAHASPAAAEGGPSGPGLAAWFGLLVLSLLVVLVAALLWFSRQRMRGGAASSSIDILGMRALGPREQLVVVRIEDRILVLGHTSAQINLVTELESYTAESPAASAGAGFQEQLQRWLRRKQP
jgi:flagellar protein FliO/FliZ